MKKPFITMILVLALASMACSISVNLPQPNTGSTETFPISEGKPDGSPVALVIGMGGGKLDIRPSGDKLVEGTVEYNVPEWKPEITRDGGEVRIEQTIHDASFLGGKVVNNWDLRLGQVPMDLTIQAGAYEGKIDLSGLAITSLRISDGASKATVVFNKPNTTIMKDFTYSTGASNIELDGLLNANFEELNFKGGAGNYSLDFSGQISHDVKVFIDGGLGNITLKVPKGVNAQINVSGGLNNVSTQGTWTIEGQEYHTIGAQGPLLKIQVSMGVGNLQLVNK
jgi:hypothetical protein